MPYTIEIITIPPLPGEDDDPGDERSVMKSWEEEGTTYNWMCPHGADIRDCLRCNPYEA